MPASTPADASPPLHRAPNSFYEALRLWDPTHKDKDDETEPHQPHKLDYLHPMPLLPNCVIQRRAQAVMALQRIECLTVTTNKALKAYRVSVFCRDSRSRIPVHGPYGEAVRVLQRSPCPTSVEPSVTLRIRFDEFRQLRYDAYAFARLSHEDGSLCGFCRDVVVLNATSYVRPRWSARLFKSDRETCNLLAAYLTEMLNLCAQVPPSGGDLCRGQERVPRLLQLFLRSHESVRLSLQATT